MWKYLLRRGFAAAHPILLTQPAKSDAKTADEAFAAADFSDDNLGPDSTDDNLGLDSTDGNLGPDFPDANLGPKEGPRGLGL